MTPAPGPIPLRTLLILSAVVLLAHAVVVHNTALSLAPDERTGTRVFSTRVLQIKADAPAAPAPAARSTVAPTPRTPAAAAPVETATAAPTPTTAPKPAEEPLLQPAAPAPEPAASVAQASVELPPLVAPPAPVAAAPAEAGTPLTRDLAQVPRNYAVPGSVRLKFNATGQRSKLNYQALGELVWLHDGSTYQARLELNALFVGSRVLSSTGRLTGDGLAPTRFSDRFRSELAAHFDRDRDRVTFSANTPEAALLPGAQDQLSVFMQLAAMVAGEPGGYPAGTTVTLQAVGTRAAEPWTFIAEVPEKLHLPGGEQVALKFTRAPRREFDQKVEIWLAPALSYLPARILITQSNGDFVDQQWRATAPP